MTIRNLIQRYKSASACKAHNRLDKAEATVEPKPKQSAEGGVLFWFPASSGTKKNRNLINNYLSHYNQTADS